MKKQKIIVGVIAIAAAVLSIAAYLFFPIKPFLHLNSGDVQQMLVFAAPPETTVELTSDEIGEAVNFLKDLVVYQPNYKADFTAGQIVRFTIIYADGTTDEMAVSGNTVSLSGKSYRVNYKSAEALNVFSNQVIE